MITKKINKFLIIGISFIILGSLSSCLKNSSYDYDFAGAAASVDFPLAASNTNGLVAFAYDAATTDKAVIPIIINLASPKVLSTSVTATLALDTAYLSQYNTDNGTDYQLLPDSVYTLSKGFSLTIPAGQRLDSTVLTIDFSKVDLSQTYVFPVTITTASVPIEQWNHLLISAILKNQYDGLYNAYGYFVHPSLGGPFNYPDLPAVTSGPASVTITQPYGGGLLGVYPTLTVGASLGGGIYAVTVTNPSGSLPLFTSPVEAGYVNKYDSNTKTFYINYGYTTSAPREATDTLVYDKPR